MCGIAGFVGGSGSRDGQEQLLRQMGRMLERRGPDGEGRWIDDEHNVAFVHRRLAIVDLSPTGIQPMESPSGRYVITYNGEIYNYLDLRRSLDTQWRGTSDTEVLLAAIDKWGVSEALSRVVGMFAFALWDRKDAKLTLGRDRLGEKPLYYGWIGSGADRRFAFASELQALRTLPGFSNEIDREALCSLIRQGNVGGQRSIYTGTAKLAPGSTLELDVATGSVRESVYWSLTELARSDRLQRFDGSFDAAADRLEVLLADAIKRQMVADVPIGAFLSGGVDSSTIAALMQAQASGPVHTFSIGFEEEQYNEAEHAQAVAAHLGTDHTELFVTAADALALIPQLPQIYTEPFADSSQIPTYLLAKLTRQHVTVALSGDAGDELFAGYNRHRIIASMWPKLRRIPWPLRRAAALGMLAAPPFLRDAMATRGGMVQGRDKFQKAALALDSKDEAHLYRNLISQWTNPENVVIGSNGGDAATTSGLGDSNLVEAIMVRDMLGYLPDDILTKVDRAAMANSLETRVPMLDHRVVEFALTLPLEYKLQGSTSKRVLREVLYRHVPRALIERPKAGFGVPIDSWLRGPLREWANDLLSPQSLHSDGYLAVEPIQRKWQEHLSGKRNWQHALWNVLMFQSWRQHESQAGRPAI